MLCCGNASFREIRLSQTGYVARGGVARACCPEAFDALHGLDAAACTNSRTVQRGGGTGEFELALQRPTLKQPVDESRVKNVARSGGVHRLHMKGRSVVELCAVPG